MYLPNDSGSLVRRFGNTLQFLDHQKKSEEKYFFHRGEKLENILVAEKFSGRKFQDFHRKFSKKSKNRKSWISIEKFSDFRFSKIFDEKSK